MLCINLRRAVTCLSGGSSGIDLHRSKRGLFDGCQSNLFGAHLLLFIGQVIKQFEPSRFDSNNIIFCHALENRMRGHLNNTYSVIFSIIHWLEFSSLGSSRCKYVCPRALAVPPAPNRGLQGDSDYFHKMVNGTILAVIVAPAIRVRRRKPNNDTGAIFANGQLNRIELNASCNSLAEDEAMSLFSKKLEKISPHNLFPLVFFSL